MLLSEIQVGQVLRIGKERVPPAWQGTIVRVIENLCDGYVRCQRVGDLFEIKVLVHPAVLEVPT